jgi:NAD(P)H-dependent flavin oxidoreductase YrpB (nitropropane dioxygenase family)
MGTRFCATAEAPMHDNIKRAMSKHDKCATDLIFRSYRDTARVDRNAISQEGRRLEAEGHPFEEVAHLVKGGRGRNGRNGGDRDHGLWTVQGLIHDVPTVAELIERIMAEAGSLVRDRLAGMMAGAAP